MSNFQETVNVNLKRQIETSLTKPAVLPVNPDGIPGNLKKLRIWVLWNYVWKEEEQRWTKVPFQPRLAKPEYEAKTGHTHYPAKSDRENTWSLWMPVWGAYDAGGWDGVGIVLKTLRLSGGDLDNVFDGNGSLKLHAAAILKQLPTYTERSPSGTRLKILLRASFEELGTHLGIDGKLPRKLKSAVGDIEFYDKTSSRFFTLTGQQFGEETEIRELQEPFQRLYENLFHSRLEALKAVKARTARSTSVCGSDDLVVQTMFRAANGQKVAKLWNGDLSDYHDDASSADLALCCHLAFYARDPAAIDRLFRASGLFRDKWERQDYRERTIAKALEQTTETYNWDAHTPEVNSNPVATQDRWAKFERVQPISVVIPSSNGRHLGGGHPDRNHKASQETNRLRPTREKECEGEGKKPKKDPVKVLVELVLADSELFRSGFDAYVSVQRGDHRETYPVASSAFAEWLRGTNYEVHGKSVSDTQVGAVSDILSFLAKSKTEKRVYLRVARLTDRIYIDLCDDRWRAIEVTREGWRVVEDHPVKFRRNRNAAPLVIPVHQGNTDLIHPFLATDEDNVPLIKGFVLCALAGVSPFPIMGVSGEQGSVKSTLCRVIKRLIDPVHKGELGVMPEDSKGFASDATNEYLLVYENVSKITPEQSDNLCRVSTGGGLKARQLYTDNEQFVADVCNPVIINGIPDFVERGDLGQRTLSILQPGIDPKDRKTEEELWAEFWPAAPSILGGFLDLIVHGLRRHPTTKIEELPRMADAALWVTACFGDDSYLKAMQAAHAETESQSLDASPVAPLLKQFLGTPPKHDFSTEPWNANTWSGTASELHDALLHFAKNNAVTLSPYFPNTAKTLSDRIRRDAPALRSGSINVNWKHTKVRRLIHITPVAG